MRKPDKRSVSERCSAVQVKNIPEPPKIEGSELLTQTGWRTYRRLYAHGPDRWTEADLSLLVEAGLIAQRLHGVRVELQLSPQTVVTPQGVVAHPLLKQEAALARDFRSCLAALAIRSRDFVRGHGQPAAGTHVDDDAAPAPTDDDGEGLPGYLLKLVSDNG